MLHANSSEEFSTFARKVAIHPRTRYAQPRSTPTVATTLTRLFNRKRKAPDRTVLEIFKNRLTEVILHSTGNVEMCVLIASHYGYAFRLL